MARVKAKLQTVSATHKIIAVVLFCFPMVGLAASLSYLAVVSR